MAEQTCYDSETRHCCKESSRCKKEGNEMSKMKRLFEEWMDDVTADLEKMQADFEKHAEKLDRKLGLK